MTRTGRRHLKALALLPPTDDLAARTLLQSVVPGLVSLSTRSGHDDEATLDEMTTIAWMMSGSILATILRPRVFGEHLAGLTAEADQPAKRVRTRLRWHRG